jgi:DNA polymerase elongation subunit (family B)
MSLANGVLYTYYKQWGNKILFRYRKNRVSHTTMVDFYKPSLFINAQNNEPDAYSIFDVPLSRKQFDSIKEAKGFVDTYKDVEGMEIHGNSNFANQFIIDLYEGKMPEFTVNDIRQCILDIEVDSPDGFPEPAKADWPINGVTIYDNFTDTFYAIGDVDYVHDVNHSDIGKLNVHYTRCYNEIEILKAMLENISLFQYDFTSGWNSGKFDMPYIVNRCYKILGEKYTVDKLSPFGNIRVYSSYDDFGGETVQVDIQGLPHLDYLDLYKKHIFTPRESYRLDFIAECELGENKLSYEEAGSLSNLYRTDPQRFQEYNIQDVNLIRRLDNKLGLFSITYTLAYYTLSNFEDTLGTTKAWEQLVAKFLYTKNKVPLFKQKKSQSRPFEGGYVKDPIVGKHDWVFSIDLNSLYPHIEMQVNIGPETHIPRDQLPVEVAELKSKYTLDDLVSGKADLSPLQKHDISMAANFECYRRDKKSFFSEIKFMLYAERKMYKKKMLAAEQQLVDIEQELKRRGLS